MTMTAYEPSDPNAVSGRYGDSEGRQQREIVEWTKKKFAQAREDRMPTQRLWEENLRFYYGEQWLRPREGFNATLNGPLHVPARTAYWVARPVINRIRPTIRHEMARLTSSKPSATVAPASSDEEDMYAALAGEQIWDSTYREYKLNRVLRKAVFWQTVCGVGFIKDYWDPERFSRCADYRPPQLQNIPDGDFAFTAEAPFHIYAADLKEEDVEGQPYIFHAQIKTWDEVKLYYPSLKQGGNYYSDSDAIGGNVHQPTEGQKARDKSVLVLECWVKPGVTKMFPNGAMYTVVNDQIIQMADYWPYQHGEYPFSKIDHMPTGRFFGESVIRDLIPLQKELNRTHGQIIESKNRMAKPQLLAPRGSIDPSRITSEPGLVIEYKPGWERPTPLELQPLPSYVENTIERLKVDWSDIAGIHEVSKGSVPSGVTAATAISYLQEKDETMLSFSVGTIEDAMERVAKHTLSNVQQFWTDERTVKVVGQNQTFDFMAFRGSDLRGNTDIRVEAGSALPTSKAAKQAALMEWVQQGLISAEDFFSVIEMGGIGKIYDKLQVDKRQIERENIAMMRATEEEIAMHNQMQLQEVVESGVAELNEDGLPIDIRTGQILPPELIVPVNTFDNHIAHIEEHNNYRKGQAYARASEHTKKLFDNHVQMHLDALIARINGRNTMGMPPEQAGMGGEEMMPPPEGEAYPFEDVPVGGDETAMMEAEAGGMPAEGGDQGAVPE